MSEKGPFDAAITTIRWSLSHFTPEARKDSEAAIRVLTAAGKMDKNDLKYCINIYPCPFRTLLESLPEPEEERK